MPVVGDALKFLGGISSKRQMPTFAPETFKSWFHDRQPKHDRRSPRPALARHLQQPFPPADGHRGRRGARGRGFRGVVPRRSLCCGRPLYDFGMLETAKKLLRQILETLRPEIEAVLRSSGWSRAAWRSSATS